MNVYHRTTQPDTWLDGCSKATRDGKEKRYRCFYATERNLKDLTQMCEDKSAAQTREKNAAKPTVSDVAESIMLIKTVEISTQNFFFFFHRRVEKTSVLSPTFFTIITSRIIIIYSYKRCPPKTKTRSVRSEINPSPRHPCKRCNKIQYVNAITTAIIIPKNLIDRARIGYYEIFWFSHTHSLHSSITYTEDHSRAYGLVPLISVTIYYNMPPLPVGETIFFFPFFRHATIKAYRLEKKKKKRRKLFFFSF